MNSLPIILDRSVKAVTDSVLAWYQKAGRQLPWRQTTDSYAILVSETMLQQTQAERVIPKYQAWMAQFPNPLALAQASPAAVLTAWSGLGYNRRALFLKAAAEVLAQTTQRPTSPEEWQRLPGVGPYTAAAICIFAENQDVAAIDTNIQRFYQLIRLGDQSPAQPAELLAVAEQFLPIGRSRDWHNALMDLSQAIRHHKTAKAQQQALVEILPVLKQLPLPQLSATRLHRPKQASLKKSPRYWRGKILRLLTKQPQVASHQLEAQLKAEDPDYPYPYSSIIHSLIKDRLIAADGDWLSLPKGES